jgi:hypothetical protein
MALTDKQISIVKGMLARGDTQSDIAAFFACNGGRIAEISTGMKGEHVPLAPSHELPPTGPYIVVTKAFKDSLEAFLREIRRWEDFSEDK